MAAMIMASANCSGECTAETFAYSTKVVNVCRVKSVTSGHTSFVFVIHAVQASWETSFDSLKVNMYHTRESHALRPRSNHQRRQDEPDATRTITNNMATYLVPEPTATSTADVNTLDLNHSLDPNQSLIPFSNSTLLSCRNCSTFGSLDFSFVSFSFQDNIIDRILEPPLELSDVFQGGEATIVAHGMGVRMEFSTNVTRNDTLNIPLFEIPLVYGIAVSFLYSNL
jgi:hypothetical protein